MKIKVVGAGSVGNHLSNAARQLGWSVDMVDTDPEALERTRTQIYPSRYGKWYEGIDLFLKGREPFGGYGIICIGTPPDTHVELAQDALLERPNAILIEKPLCCPDLVGMDELLEDADEARIPVFVGYDHLVSPMVDKVVDVVMGGLIGDVVTIDVEFREHWGGILRAHPWLSGPHDSYLGFSERGGGASGEHSHALSMWQHLAHAAGAGIITMVSAMMKFVDDYDQVCAMNLVTENGLMGRCVQDVVTDPPRKWARIQGTDGFVEWHGSATAERIVGRYVGGHEFDRTVEKTRADDFVRELTHVARLPILSPISLGRGAHAMRVLAAAHHSAKTGNRIEGVL